MKYKYETKPWQLPNPWHFQQKLRGGRIHKKKKGEIPRRAKYKNKDTYDY